MKKEVLMVVCALGIGLSNSGRAEIRVLDATFAGDGSGGIAAPIPSDGGPWNTGPIIVKDKFGQLEDLFSKAVTPKNEEVLGWTTGRCFDYLHRETATNSILIGWMEEGGPDNGPLFPSKKILKVIVAVNTVSGSDYFDNLTPEKEKSTTEWLDSPQGKVAVSNAFIEDNSLVSFHSSGIRWNIRKSPEYLTMQAVMNNQVTNYCYFFKKLK